MADGEEENNSIRVCGMQFSYEGQPPIFADFNLNIKPGSRCLLVGANGSGKSINQSYRFYLFTHSFFTSVNYPFEVRDESRGFFFRKVCLLYQKNRKNKNTQLLNCTGNYLCCAGKTTLLKILAGRHMVGGRDVVRVLNRSAFHDTQLVCDGDLSYLGGSWSKTIGSAVSSLTLLLYYLIFFKNYNSLMIQLCLYNIMLLMRCL